MDPGAGACSFRRSMSPGAIPDAPLKAVGVTCSPLSLAVAWFRTSRSVDSAAAWAKAGPSAAAATLSTAATDVATYSRDRERMLRRTNAQRSRGVPAAPPLTARDTLATVPANHADDNRPAHPAARRAPVPASAPLWGLPRRPGRSYAARHDDDRLDGPRRRARHVEALPAAVLAADRRLARRRGGAGLRDRVRARE